MAGVDFQDKGPPFRSTVCIAPGGSLVAQALRLRSREWRTDRLDRSVVQRLEQRLRNLPAMWQRKHMQALAPRSFVRVFQVRSPRWWKIRWMEPGVE